MEERHKRHREHHNSTINATTSLKVEDIVKSHVQVQSKSKSAIAKKLSYQVKGPFIVTKCLHQNAFEVKPYNRPNGATRKKKATELYLLPLALYPSEPIDTIDQRYLNCKHASILHPLKKSMQIELHNDTYFHPKPRTCKPNHQINPLCTSPNSYFNPTTPN